MKYDDAIYEVDEIKSTRCFTNRQIEALDLAIEALQEKAERENPQPLTLGQLKERVGKPVWFKYTDNAGRWRICGKQYNGFQFFRQGSSAITEDYNKTWVAYDHEPKEEK